MCFIHIMASSFKGAAHTQLIKVSPKSEVALATRNWSGRLPFPIHSKKRNAQNY